MVRCPFPHLQFLLIKEDDERRYVNVDMTTARGLARAKDLKLASSGVADVVISNDIHGVLDIFNNRNILANSF